MSLIKTLSDMTAERDALNVSLESAKAESNTLKTRIAELENTLKARDESIVKFYADLKAAAVSLEKEQKAHKATSEELATAKEQLSNPAFLAAAVKGSKVGATEGGSEAGKEINGPQTKKEALEQYNKIEGARERAEFRLKHKEILGL